MVFKNTLLGIRKSVDFLIFEFSGGIHLRRLMLTNSNVFSSVNHPPPISRFARTEPLKKNVHPAFDRKVKFSKEKRQKIAK